MSRFLVVLFLILSGCGTVNPFVPTPLPPDSSPVLVKILTGVTNHVEAASTQVGAAHEEVKAAIPDAGPVGKPKLVSAESRLTQVESELQFAMEDIVQLKKQIVTVQEEVKKRDTAITNLNTIAAEATGKLIVAEKKVEAWQTKWENSWVAGKFWFWFWWIAAGSFATIAILAVINYYTFGFDWIVKVCGAALVSIVKAPFLFIGAIWTKIKTSPHEVSTEVK